MDLVWTDEDIEQVRDQFGDEVAERTAKLVDQLADQLEWLPSKQHVHQRMNTMIEDFAGEKYLFVRGDAYRVLFILLEEAVVFYRVITKEKRRQNTILDGLRSNRQRALQEAREKYREVHDGAPGD